MPKTIVITGGIGSGKSTVCQHLADRGFPVYYCDDRAKALYEEVPGLLLAVEQTVGRCLTLPDGSFDRAALAEAIFSDRTLRGRVEALVHPEVYADFVRWRDAQRAPWVVMESAIFMQKPLFHPLADALVSVVCSPEQMVRRVMSRDSSDRESVERRILSQELVPCEGPVPDETIVNDRDPETLYSRVDEVINRITTKTNNNYSI